MSEQWSQLKGQWSRTADREVTARQREILTMIHEHQSLHGISPTIREIGDALFIRSTNGVNDHLESLTLKGCIERTSTTARSIQLTARGRLLVGIPSLKGAAQTALAVLDELATKPLGEQLDRRITDARAELRKAGVRL